MFQPKKFNFKKFVNLSAGQLFYKNDVRTKAMQKREERIAKKRNNIKNTANIERIRKRMRTIYNECSDISSHRRKNSR